MSAVLFFIAALGAITGAVGVVMLRDPFYSVLALVCHLVSLAALFLLLRAEFVAAGQVVVYAGAVMVLYVFVVAYVGGLAETGSYAMAGSASGLRVLGPLFALLLAVELLVALLGTGLRGIGHDGAPYAAGFGSPRAIGTFLLTRFLAPFEIASLLLLIAAVGAVVLARRRAGLEDDGSDAQVGALHAPRPAWTGTMAEAVEGRHGAGDPAAEEGLEPVGPRAGGW